MLGAYGQRVVLADDDRGAGVLDAVGELVLGEPPRERHRDRSRPLTRPVEERGLGPVVEDERHAIAGRDGQATGDRAHPREQVAVRDPGEGLELGVTLGGAEERLGEIHAPAASTMASTIGA